MLKSKLARKAGEERYLETTKFTDLLKFFEMLVKLLKNYILFDRCFLELFNLNIL